MSVHNTVKFKLDTENSSKLSKSQRERLQAVEALHDSEIDYSDIPQQSAAVQWTRPGAFAFAENKQQVTLRLDPDVLGFFKASGKRYQSRINAVLREYMDAHQDPTGKKV